MTTTTTQTSRYTITADRERAQAATLREARAAARRMWQPRHTYQDVRIERADGSLVEYAGPSR